MHTDLLLHNAFFNKSEEGQYIVQSLWIRERSTHVTAIYVA